MSDNNCIELQAFELRVDTEPPTYDYFLDKEEAIAAAISIAVKSGKSEVEASVESITFVLFPTSELSPIARIHARNKMNAVAFFAADTIDGKFVLGYLKDEPGDYYSLIYKCQPDESNPQRFDSDVVEPLLKQLLETASDNS